MSKDIKSKLKNLHQIHEESEKLQKQETSSSSSKWLLIVACIAFLGICAVCLPLIQLPVSVNAIVKEILQGNSGVKEKLVSYNKKTHYQIANKLLESPQEVNKENVQLVFEVVEANIDDFALAPYLLELMDDNDPIVLQRTQRSLVRLLKRFPEGLQMLSRKVLKHPEKPIEERYLAILLSLDDLQESITKEILETIYTNPKRTYLSLENIEKLGWLQENNSLVIKTLVESCYKYPAICEHILWTLVSKKPQFLAEVFKHPSNLETLWYFSGHHLLPGVLLALKSDEAKVREKAISLISSGYLEENLLQEVVTLCHQDNNAAVRALAVTTIANYWDKYSEKTDLTKQWIAKELLVFMNDSDETVRYTTVQALFLLPNEPGINIAIMRSLKDSSKISNYTTWRLKKPPFLKNVSSDLLSALQDQQQYVYRNALKIFPYYGAGLTEAVAILQQKFREDPEVAPSCLLALATIGKVESVVPFLLEILEQQKPSEYSAQKDLQNASALLTKDINKSGLYEFPVGVYDCAVWALSQVATAENTEVVDTLLASLHHHNFLVRAYAAQSLGNMQVTNAKAVWELFQLIERDDKLLLQRQQQLKQQLDDFEYGLLIDICDFVCDRASQALTRILTKDRSLKDHFHRACKHENYFVRQVAITVLGSTAVSDEDISALIPYTSDSVAHVRRSAINTLGQHSQKPQIKPLLVNATDDPKEQVRLIAAQSLVKTLLEEDVALAITTCQKFQNTKTQLQVLQELELSLNKSENSQINEKTLQPFLESDDDDLRASALRILKHSPNKDMLMQTAIKNLNKRYDVRKEAIIILYEQATPELLPQLLTIVKDGDLDISSSIALVASKLKDSAVLLVPAIVQKWQQFPNYGASDIYTYRIRYMSALGNIGETAKEAIPALQELYHPSILTTKDLIRARTEISRLYKIDDLIYTMMSSHSQNDMLYWVWVDTMGKIGRITQK